MSWTTDRVEQLRKLWQSGLSASEVAAKLGGFRGSPDGGRNAVIGKIHRDKIVRVNGRKPGWKGTNEARRNRKEGSSDSGATQRLNRKSKGWSSVSLPPLPVVETRPEVDMIPRRLPDSTAEAVTALRGYVGGEDAQCRYPLGNPGMAGFHFCNRDALPTKPYCSEHQSLAIQPYQRRAR